MINREEILKIAKLSALEFSGEELDNIVKDMDEITEFARLVSGAELCDNGETESGRAPLEALREDRAESSFPQSAVLSSAENENGMFRVKGGI